jgi:hypothetical protein
VTGLYYTSTPRGHRQGALRIDLYLFPGCMGEEAESFGVALTKLSTLRIPEDRMQSADVAFGSEIHELNCNHRISDQRSESSEQCEIRDQREKKSQRGGQRGALDSIYQPLESCYHGPVGSSDAVTESTQVHPPK